MRPIVDLHCDLLAYLANGEGRTADDAASRASLPQLAAGGVRAQVVAIFAPTRIPGPGPATGSDSAPPGSGTTAGGGLGRDALTWGRRQVEAYRRLLRDANDRVYAIGTEGADGDGHDGSRRIGLLPAFENASTFAGEDEPLADAIARLDSMLATLGPTLYVGLTWAGDNRFGGGNRSRRGLTDDGRRLLDHLASRRHQGRGGPAVDLAHASPWLAEGVIEHREKTGSALPMLVSHSSFRRFVDTPRNVDDDTARAVADSGGVIGLNLMRWWNGDRAPDCFVDQLRHAIRLGLDSAFALGADFFCTEDVPDHLRSRDSGDEFFADFADAGCYPRLLAAFSDAIEGHGAIDDGLLDLVAYRNAERFIAHVLDDRSEFPIDNPRPV